MPKKVIIREDQLKQMVLAMANEPAQSVKYPIDPKMVLMVKKFLDGNFKRGMMDELGEDGMPRKVRVVAMTYPDGSVAKNMYEEDLKDLLIDKFQNIYTDKDRRDKFLGQVMKDWYDNKIGLYGSLSVNHL